MSNGTSVIKEIPLMYRLSSSLRPSELTRIDPPPMTSIAIMGLFRTVSEINCTAISV